MNSNPDIARLAALVTESARAAMLVHLLDGRSWTATELARAAGIRAPAASAHLKKLVAAELIKVSPNGRHRYFRLASAELARLVEQLQGFAPTQVIATPGQRRASEALRTCRLCYDHLAGPLGAGLAQALIDRKLLLRDARSRALRVSPLGKDAIGAIFGISATTVAEI